MTRRPEGLSRWSTNHITSKPRPALIPMRCANFLTTWTKNAYSCSVSVGFERSKSSASLKTQISYSPGRAALPRRLWKVSPPFGMRELIISLRRSVMRSGSGNSRKRQRERLWDGLRTLRIRIELFSKIKIISPILICISSRSNENYLKGRILPYMITRLMYVSSK